jgi:hypothetical protein
MEIDKEKNRIELERMGFHLDEAMRFCNKLDLSGLGPLEQREWDTKMKNWKDAIAFCRESLKKLNQILE